MSRLEQIKASCTITLGLVHQAQAFQISSAKEKEEDREDVISEKETLSGE